MSSGLDIDELLSKDFRQEDADRVSAQFEEALQKAQARDGGRLDQLVQNLWVHFNNTETPQDVQKLAGVALLYFVVPWDVVPDMVPLVGYADDLMVVSLALKKIGLLSKVARNARESFRSAYRL